MTKDKIKSAVANVLSKNTANFAAMYNLFFPIRLIKMAYQSVNLELSDSDIPEALVPKIEAKGDELINLCESKLGTDFQALFN